MSKLSKPFSLVAILAFGAIAAALAGCTDEQVKAAVNTACAAAAAGTTVYVQVESDNGQTAQNISKQVQGDVTTDCPVIEAAAAAAVSSINAAGQSATVTVSTSAPASLKRVVVAKFKVRRRVGEQPSVTIVVKPLSTGIPVVSDIINSLGSL